jgi:alkaline phosphatase
VVVADHETGGMSVSLLSSGKSDEDGPFDILGGGVFYVNWGTGGHTAANVPLTASGPGADQLAGVHENTIVHDVILEAFCSFGEMQLDLVEGENPCDESEIENQ